jgi:hypothetical protein
MSHGRASAKHGNTVPFPKLEQCCNGHWIGATRLEDGSVPDSCTGSAFSAVTA